MKSDILKDISLHDELLTSVKLIELGFAEYQNLDLANDFYYLPFQLLSSGFERLMKCHICLGHLEQHHKYPSYKYLKGCGGKNGHDLLLLKSKIIATYFSTHTIPALNEDYDFLTNDDDLDRLIYLLSEFGKYARYYNFDIVTSAETPSVDVKGLWEEYESGLIAADQQLMRKAQDFEFGEEAINYAKRQILIKLEKFARAICRQFTMGRLGARALQYSGALHSLILINNEELGNRNYRIESRRYRNQERTVHTRTPRDEVERKTNKRYRHAVIRKDEFEGDWPFYHDEVIIECREKYWCVVTIDNKDYALNGSAKGRYKLEDVHEAGMAILGKSVGPFINMAINLGKDT